jgi:hypothetical protein
MRGRLGDRERRSLACEEYAGHFDNCRRVGDAILKGNCDGIEVVVKSVVWFAARCSAFILCRLF